MANPFDDIFNILYIKPLPDDKPGRKFTKNFVLNQYKYRLHIKKIQEQLLNLFRPKIIIK